MLSVILVRLADERDNMSVCTFFGHRDCPESIKPILRSTLVDLIQNQGVDLFYVGNQGQFDAYVRRTLQELTRIYPHVRYAVVLACLPGIAGEYEDASDTVLPEGLETVHPRFAVSRRNEWMLCRADFAVTYITHTWGGAYRYAGKARKQRKTVINLACVPGPAVPQN